jgi:hypothetical protein
MTAFALSLGLTDFVKIQPIFAFALTYLPLVFLTSYLMLRNGRWAVDGRFIYKGWRLSPYVAVSEIEHAQIGIPDSWVKAVAHLPGGHIVGLVEAVQNDALVLRLSGNRWLVWQFLGMVNRDQFVHAVLEHSPSIGGDATHFAVPINFPLLRVGKILQA